MENNYCQDGESAVFFLTLQTYIHRNVLSKISKVTANSSGLCRLRKFKVHTYVSAINGADNEGLL